MRNFHSDYFSLFSLYSSWPSLIFIKIVQLTATNCHINLHYFLSFSILFLVEKKTIFNAFFNTTFHQLSLNISFIFHSCFLRKMNVQEAAKKRSLSTWIIMNFLAYFLTVFFIPFLFFLYSFILNTVIFPHHLENTSSKKSKIKSLSCLICCIKCLLCYKSCKKMQKIIKMFYDLSF